MVVVPIGVKLTGIIAPDDGIVLATRWQWLEGGWLVVMVNDGVDGCWTDTGRLDLEVLVLVLGTSVILVARH